VGRQTWKLQRAGFFEEGACGYDWQIAELKEALKCEEALRLCYEKELQRINKLPYSPGEKMQLIDRINYFLECTSNLIFFGEFKPTSPRHF
jgi:hypothetical protein